MKETSLLPQTLSEGGIRYRAMLENDLDEVASCFASSFQREPMVQQLNIQKDEFMPFALVCCQQAIEQGMGLVAIDEASEKIAGFTILQDALFEMPFDISQHQNFLPIFELLGQLQSKYIIDKKVEHQGEVVVSFVTGVSPEFQGTKVAFLLFGQSLELAKEKKYKKMITEVTGRLSQNGVRRRYAFTPYTSILYREFLFDGKPVFGNIKDQSLSCVLMEKSLLN